MAYDESNSHVTDEVTRPRTVKVVTPRTLSAQYLENCWRCSLGTIVNYKIICWEALLSASLATAWLLASQKKCRRTGHCPDTSSTPCSSSSPPLIHCWIQSLQLDRTTLPSFIPSSLLFLPLSLPLRPSFRSRPYS